MKKYALKKHWSQLGLIFMIYDLDHEIGMTPLKANPKKQRRKILNQINIERWNWKKSNQSKNQCKTKKIAIKIIINKFFIKIN